MIIYIYFIWKYIFEKIKKMTYKNLQASGNKCSMEPNVIFDPGSCHSTVFKVSKIRQPAYERNCSKTKTGKAESFFQVFFEIQQAEILS